MWADGNTNCNLIALIQKGNKWRFLAQVQAGRQLSFYFIMTPGAPPLPPLIIQWFPCNLFLGFPIIQSSFSAEEYLSHLARFVKYSFCTDVNLCDKRLFFIIINTLKTPISCIWTVWVQLDQIKLTVAWAYKCHHILIQTFFNPHWCMEVCDIAFLAPPQQSEASP